MKNLIIAVVLVGLSMVAFGQELPNANFQDWETIGTYQNPVFWSTSNDPLLALASVIPVTRSNEAYSGDYSAKLETLGIPFSTYKIPGLLTLAQISINYENATYSISGGMALQENVSRLTGMYKYDGSEGDSASVIIYNYRLDEGNMDTIGFGVGLLPDASTWTPFYVDMVNLNNHLPDTFNVVIISSSGFEVSAGSVLFVDSLAIETNTGIIHLDADQIIVNAYPNPATDLISFKTNGSEKDRIISIYDMVGNLIGTSNFSESYIEIPISELSSGLFTFRVTTHDRLLSRGSFIKK